MSGRLSPFHHGIPIVAGDAERSVLFPSPSTHQRVFNRTSGNIERYNGASWVTDFIGAGGVLFVHNVRSYGATGDETQDDAPFIQAAIDAAEAAGGGIVFLPRGSYKLASTVTLDATSTNSIYLIGQGRRDTGLYGSTAGMTVLRVGAATPDTSGTSTNATYYGKLADFAIYGTYPDVETGRGLYLVEPHRWVVENVNIEEFDGVGGIGIELRGSTTSGGIGASAAPHAWRNQFQSVQVSNCRRPLVITNGDENGFYNCNFALPSALTGLASDSVIAIEITQGRNNRFFDTLLSGRAVADADRAAYVGVKFVEPVNGDVLGNVFYGLVAEGFNKPVWFDGSNVRACGVRDYNSSINAVDFTDDGAQTGSANFVDSPLHHLHYRATRESYGDTIAFTASDATPSVQKGNIFVTNNGSATTITNFDDGKSGQIIVIRLDANTTVQHNANIKLASGADLVGTANDIVSLVNMGGTWYEQSRSVNG